MVWLIFSTARPIASVRSVGVRRCLCLALIGLHPAKRNPGHRAIACTSARAGARFHTAAIGADIDLNVHVDGGICRADSTVDLGDIQEIVDAHAEAPVPGRLARRSSFEAPTISLVMSTSRPPLG